MNDVIEMQIFISVRTRFLIFPLTENVTVELVHHSK
jgi:hypothetical protein